MRPFFADKRNPLPPIALVATGLFLIAGSLIWPRVTALHGTMSSGGIDFIQGFLIGIGLACELMGIAGMLGARRKRNSPPNGLA